MTLIGMSLDGALELLEAKQIKANIVENFSDRPGEFDSVLVTNAVFDEDNNTCTLTVSKFKLNI